LPFIEADVYDGQVVIVSQYVKDGSLAKWLKENDGKAPNHGEAVRIINGILDGLEHLHNKGIVHRDLKPPNILLQEGRPRIADFGISRILKATAHSSSVTTGTPLYMPPEAFEGKRSFEADIWSVGALFQQLLTGMLPFDEPDPMALMYSILQKHPNPLPAEIPSNFRQLIATCLTKNPEGRFASIKDLRMALNNSSYGQDSENDSIVAFVTAPADRKPSEQQTHVIPNDSTPRPTEAYVAAQVVNSDDSNMKKKEQLTAINQFPNVVSALGSSNKTRKFPVKIIALVSLAILLFVALTSSAVFVYFQYVKFGADDYFLRALKCSDNKCRLENFNKAIEIDRNYAAAYWGRSTVYFYNERYPEYRRDHYKAIELDFNFENILAEYDLAIENSSDNKFAFYDRGYIYYEKKEYDKAISDLNKATELDPKFSPAYSGRGSVYVEKKEYDTSLSNLNKAIELDPTFSPYYDARGIVYGRKNQYDKALSDLNKAIELDPKYFYAYFSRGSLYRDKKQYDKALSEFNKAIELDPMFSWPYFGRGSVYVEIKRNDKALSEFNKAIELNPKLFPAYVTRGSVYVEIKQYDKALSDFNKAIELDPKVSVAYFGRGFVYAEKKQYNKAVSDFTKGIELDPDLAGAYYSRGASYKALGKQKLADEDFRKAKELERKN